MKRRWTCGDETASGAAVSVELVMMFLREYRASVATGADRIAEGVLSGLCRTVKTREQS